MNDPEKHALFDKAIMRIFSGSSYTIITAFIDKKAMLKQDRWSNLEPYHFLMDVLVEKYVQFLERRDSIGDIMPEGRKGKKDQRLQKVFASTRKNGTFYVGSKRICAKIPSSNLKIRYKPDNIAGLQLCDLLAHPSHMIIRERLDHPVILGSFCGQLKTLLMQEKYDRSANGTILGYGMKWL